MQLSPCARAVRVCAQPAFRAEAVGRFGAGLACEALIMQQHLIEVQHHPAPLCSKHKC